MSANLVVDIGGTCAFQPSLPFGAIGGMTVGTTYPGLTSSGTMASLSGMHVGASVDLLHADTFCNIYVQGLAIFASGPLNLAVQTSDTDVSGNYTDPTSGLAQLPTYFSSGGILIIGSGASPTVSPGVLGAFASGQAYLSGFSQFAGFQRLGRYARLVMLSGFFLGYLNAGFVSQLRTTGSGGGFTYSPGSGSVNV